MLGFRSLRKRSDAGQGAAGTEAGDEVGDFGAVAVDFGAGGLVVRAGIGGVLVLHRHEDGGVRLVDLLGHADCAVRAGLAGGKDDFCAEEREQIAAFNRNGFRHDAADGMAGQPPHQCDCQARVARGRFEDRLTGLERAVGVGGVDHRFGDAVLNRAGRVLAFELDPDRDIGIGRHPLQADERRVADRVEQRLIAGGSGRDHQREPPR